MTFTLEECFQTSRLDSGGQGGKFRSGLDDTVHVVVRGIEDVTHAMDDTVLALQVALVDLRSVHEILLQGQAK